MRTQILKHIREAKARLVRKHPELETLELCTLSESGLSHEAVSEFIEKCWQHDYADQSRINFSPEFLAYNLPDPGQDEISMVARNNRCIAGIVLGFPIYLMHRNEIMECVIGTGLSTLPDFRGQGLSQLLVLSVDRKAFLKGSRHMFTWFDGRHSWNGSSYEVFVGRKKVWCATGVQILAKSLDYIAANQVEKLNCFEKICVKATMRLFPAGNKLRLGYDLVPLTENDLEACHRFYLKNQTGNPYKRYLSREALWKKATYHEGPIRSVVFLMKKNKRIKGLIFGFTNPVGSGKRYFQVDSVLFEGLSYSERRLFMAAIEHVLLHDFKCFSVVIPASVANLNLMKHGYFPVTKQIFCTLYKPEESDYTENTHRNLMVELR